MKVAQTTSQLGHGDHKGTEKKKMYQKIINCDENCSIFYLFYVIMHYFLCSRWFAVFYLVFMFFLLPLVVFGLSLGTCQPGSFLHMRPIP
jgi:hypothetical protein